MVAFPGSERSYAPRDKRRRDFVDALERLLDEGRRFSDLTVQQLTDTVRVSRTSFYFHFAHPRELLLTAATGVSDDLYEAAEAWLADDDGNRPQLDHALLRIAEGYRTNATLLRAVTEVAAYDDEVRAAWRGLVDRFISAAMHRFERSSPGARRDLQATALVWMTERALLEHVATEGEDPEPIAAALADIWWTALTAGPPPEMSR